MADKELTRAEEREQIRKKYPGSFSIAVAFLAVIFFLIVGMAIYPTGEHAWGYGINLFTSIISTIATVGIIEAFNRQREKRENAVEKEVEYQKQLVIDAASTSNPIAVNAVHQLWRRGWLHDENGLLKGANLTAANLQGATLMGANLQGADLRTANLQEANLIRIILQDAHLQSANLKGGHLEFASLQRSDLKDANLEGAHLHDTHLEETNLQFSKLQKASFQFAHLIGADLSGAEVQGADFILAELQGAKLRAVQWDTSTRLPNGDFWTQETDVTRFTDPSHPQFYEPDW